MRVEEISHVRLFFAIRMLFDELFGIGLVIIDSQMCQFCCCFRHTMARSGQNHNLAL